MTDYIYARPSFLAGLARTLDLFGVFDSYNFSETSEEADFKAIYSDWKTVGADLKKTFDRCLSELNDPHG